MTTANKVAYKAVWDASSLTRGLMNTRQQFAAKKKILNEMRTPIQAYRIGMNNLQLLLEKHPDLLEHQKRIEEDLERQYLQSAEAVDGLTKKQQSRLRFLMNNERASQQHHTAEGRRASDREQRVQREKHRVEQIRRTHEGARTADQRRAREEAKSVASHRKLLDKRLKDRRRHNEQMRQKIRDNLRMVGEETRGLHAESRKQISRSSGGFLAGGGARLAGVAGIAYGGTKLIQSASQFLEKSSQVNREVERAEIAFSVFTRSGERSAAMLDQVRRISADTGVSFSAFNDAARTMLQFGTAVDAVIPRAKQISIVTGGNAERMKSLSLAIAQTTAAGRLQGQDLLQMVNAGWSPFEEISKRMNMSIPELRKQMELGAISATMVTDALKAATEEGGRFYGFLEARAGTAVRSKDRETAAWEQTNAAVGEAIEPLTKVRNLFSEHLARDIRHIANMFRDVKTEIQQVDMAEQKRQERAIALEKERQRVQAEFARQRQEAEAEKQKGLDAMPGLMRGLVNRNFSSESVRDLDRITGLLNEVHAKQATEDFLHSGGDRKVLMAFLSEEVKQELKQLEIIEKKVQKQAEQRRQMEEMQQAAERLRESLKTPQQSLSDELGKIMAMRDRGLLNDNEFTTARKQLLQETIEQQGQGISSDRVASVGVNSQQSYEFFSQLQARKTASEQNQQKRVELHNEAIKKAAERRNELLEEIADNVGIGSAG